MLITHSVLWVSRLRERNEGLLSHLPASSHMCLVGLFLLHAVIAKGWHFPKGSRVQPSLFSPFTWLETIGGRYGPLRVFSPRQARRRDVRKSENVWIPVTLPQPRPVRTRLVIRTRLQCLIHRSSSRASSASRISHSSSALFPGPKSWSRWGSSPL